MNKPDRIITDPALVTISKPREVARVKIRRGPPYLGGVHNLDRPRLDAALDKAGPGAMWTPNFDNCHYGSAWFEAVITVPQDTRPINMALGKFPAS